MATKNVSPAIQSDKKIYISQTDVPAFSLEKACSIPTAIAENYGYKPATPLQVAKALEVQPTSGGFRMLAGAAIAYGLTNGGYNAETISITPLGMRIVRPTAEGDDLIAKREALLRPRVVREFLQKYDGAAIPKDAIARNVLGEMGVPQNRTAEVLRLILEGAVAVSFLEQIKDRTYVALGNTQVQQSDGESISEDKTADVSVDTPMPKPPVMQSLLTPPPSGADPRSRRVFITHGKNKALIEPIQKLLAFGELQPVVVVQNQTVSQPVPTMVMEGMRSCGAAIIHVDDERHIIDKNEKEQIVLNENVLIEIGAAMALYGQRFILVVKQGVTLPSNLQGLLELRYSGETLDVHETVRLMEAINDMKNRPIP